MAQFLNDRNLIAYSESSAEALRDAEEIGRMKYEENPDAVMLAKHGEIFGLRVYYLYHPNDDYTPALQAAEDEGQEATVEYLRSIINPRGINLDRLPGELLRAMTYNDPHLYHRLSQLSPRSRSVLQPHREDMIQRHSTLDAKEVKNKYGWDQDLNLTKLPINPGEIWGYRSDFVNGGTDIYRRFTYSEIRSKFNQKMVNQATSSLGHIQHINLWDTFPPGQYSWRFVYTPEMARMFRLDHITTPKVSNKRKDIYSLI